MTTDDGPSLRCGETTQVLMDLFMGSVRKLLAAEFEARGLKLLSDLHCEAVAHGEMGAAVCFTVRFRGPDDTEIRLSRAEVKTR